ncbi:MAG TPA: SDR family oxidoreductase [Chloroflexota bacterium]|jgi:NAD(P)-dependent dehydrogenase (short-subunit alcohol dehydrogenase family)
MAVVLITGCSSGFGVEFAAAFARRGDSVVATMRDVARSAALLDRLGGLSVDVRTLDVTDASSIQGLVSQLDRIDVLVNNAGIGVVGALETLGPRGLRQVFETNVFGALEVTQAVLPRMRAQGSGRVVFVSAIGAILNTPYLGAYCASKHALDCLAATLDIETRPFGIRVSSVLPSAFNTGMAGNMRLEFEDPYAEAAQRYFEGLTARMAAGGRDLSAVADAVVEAATADDPKLRYLIAPHLVDVLEPVMSGLERLHERELALQTRA